LAVGFLDLDPGLVRRLVGGPLLFWKGKGAEFFSRAPRFPLNQKRATGQKVEMESRKGNNNLKKKKKRNQPNEKRKTVL